MRTAQVKAKCGNAINGLRTKIRMSKINEKVTRRWDPKDKNKLLQLRRFFYKSRASNLRTLSVKNWHFIYIYISKNILRNHSLNTENMETESKMGSSRIDLARQLELRMVHSTSNVWDFNKKKKLICRILSS